MASSSTTIHDGEENMENIEKHLAELENVENVEEFEEKVKNIPSKFAFSYWMKYLFNRAPEEEFKAEWLTIDEYKSLAEDSMQAAWRTVNLPHWRLEKKGATKGDIVESKHTDQYGKVYRLTSIVDCPPQFLFEEFKCNITRLPEWNPTILKSEVIKEIADGIDLSYQVTAGGGKGIIAPRDFVILRRAAPLARDGRVTAGEPYCYISSGVSVTVPGYAPHKDLVRGHNKVGCWVLKPKTVHSQGGRIEHQTVFQWLMCCDLKGEVI